MILCIETATSLCSVALCDKSRVTALRESDENRSHASSLTIFIMEILKEAGINAGDLDAVAVSKGPGSYTGLRIGVSVAKGIAYAASIPLIGVETLLSMFYGFTESAKENNNIMATDLFCPVIDARRMEVYYSVYNAACNKIKDIRAEIMRKDSFRDLSESSRLFVFGDGAAKCKEVIARKNIFFDGNFRTSASFMLNPVYKAFNSQCFENVAYFEPFYLKNFLTTKSVKNILGK
jgi:tRNA threonylcarbamoyladenosine biosynthesis protein TsaB